MTKQEIYDGLQASNYFEESELQLVCNAFGFGIETLNAITRARVDMDAENFLVDSSK